MGKANSHISTVSRGHGGSKRCVTINQSINQRSSRTTHGQREATSQHCLMGAANAASQSINQSKVLTEPHTGKEEPHPSTITDGQQTLRHELRSDASFWGAIMQAP